MADAKKCDRCGKFYELYGGGEKPNLIVEAYNGYFVAAFEDDYEEITRWELCPECMTEIRYHLRNGAPRE